MGDTVTKVMFVVKVTNPNHPSFGQYYGGYSKPADRPYYVKRLSRAKLYSNSKDIYIRPEIEEVFPIRMKVSDDMFEIGDRLPTPMQMSTSITTAEGHLLTACSNRIT